MADHVHAYSSRITAPGGEVYSASAHEEWDAERGV
jgi:hypothetical protein